MTLPAALPNDSEQPASLHELQMRVAAIAEHCFEQASHYYRKTLRVPEIRFDLRGACAGQAVFRKGWSGEEIYLRFNTQLLQQDPAEFFNQVVAHECAHVIARRVYGKRIKPHGVEWKSIMREVLATEPQVRHQLEIRRSARRQHHYRCQCDDHQHLLSSIRHNRIQRGEQIYLCRSCRQPLQYVTSEAPKES